jgi:hypothetical protein
LLVGNAFIVFGGDTKMDEGDVLDDTLYLLNTCEIRREPLYHYLETDSEQQQNSGPARFPPVLALQDAMDIP